MVAPGESLEAEVTLEGFVSRVFPEVPGQFVRPGELPPAVLPAAHVRLLPRVGPQVGLQVGALGVHLRVISIIIIIIIIIVIINIITINIITINIITIII